MPTAILYNRVLGDGVGDFSHFVDIYQALINNPKLHNEELISIIDCDIKYNQIIKRLEKLDIKNCLVFKAEELTKKLEENATLQKQIAEAKQIISISSHRAPKKITRYAAASVKNKLIGEHERYVDSDDSETSMGLSKNLAGIKLKNLPRMDSEEFLFLLAKREPSFLKTLLSHQPSPDIKQFAKNNILVPAYFSTPSHFLNFLNLLTFNKGFNANTEKNISIYVSGFSKIGFNREWLEKAHSSIKQIELIEEEKDGSESTHVFPVSPEGGRTISIYKGFYLGDEAYQALYQQAVIAGVSGDNTFELAVSAKVFPFPLSENYEVKAATLEALSAIIKTLALPDKVKSDFLIYFQEMASWKTLADLKKVDSVMANKFSTLDLKAMQAAWPVVALHLIKNHNFYDKLEDIFFEGIDNNLLPSQTRHL